MYVQILLRLAPLIIFVDSQHSQPLSSSCFCRCFYNDPLNTWRFSALQYFPISESDLPVQVWLIGLLVRHEWKKILFSMELLVKEDHLKTTDV